MNPIGKLAIGLMHFIKNRIGSFFTHHFSPGGVAILQHPLRYRSFAVNDYTFIT